MTPSVRQNGGKGKALFYREKVTPKITIKQLLSIRLYPFDWYRYNFLSKHYFLKILTFFMSSSKKKLVSKIDLLSRCFWNSLLDCDNSRVNGRADLLLTGIIVNLRGGLLERKESKLIYNRPSKDTYYCWS